MKKALRKKITSSRNNEIASVGSVVLSKGVRDKEIVIFFCAVYCDVFVWSMRSILLIAGATACVHGCFVCSK